MCNVYSVMIINIYRVLCTSLECKPCIWNKVQNILLWLLTVILSFVNNLGLSNWVEKVYHYRVLLETVELFVLTSVTASSSNCPFSS